MERKYGLSEAMQLLKEQNDNEINLKNASSSTTETARFNNNLRSVLNLK